MHTDKLIDALFHSSLKTKLDLVSAFKAEVNFSLSDLLELTFHPDQRVAFRAAWVFEDMVIKYPEAFRPLLPRFLLLFPGQENFSAQRHFAKIMLIISHKKYPLQNDLANADLDEVIHTLFAWLIGERTPVAVKANAMEALVNLSARYPWIKDELIETVNFLSDKESIAFFGRAKRVMRKL